MVSPRLALERRVVDDHELAGWVEGVGGKIYGRAVKPGQADRDGSKAEWRMLLRVSSVAGRRSHQRSGGKVMWAEERTEIK